jgi:hypothetical protein
MEGTGRCDWGDWESIFTICRAHLAGFPSAPGAVAELLAKIGTGQLRGEDPAFWQRVAGCDFASAGRRISRWSNDPRKAPTRLGEWDLLFLDLGDCPEIFHAFHYPLVREMKESDVLTILQSHSFFDLYELPPLLPDGNPHRDGKRLHAWERTTIYDHHVSELRHPVLSWTHRDDSDFGGNDGYFLWLLVASSAFLEPLRARAARQRLLAGRKRVYVSAGFEQLFMALATVTLELLEPIGQ